MGQRSPDPRAKGHLTLAPAMPWRRPSPSPPSRYPASSFVSFLVALLAHHAVGPVGQVRLSATHASHSSHPSHLSHPLCAYGAFAPLHPVSPDAPRSCNDSIVKDRLPHCGTPKGLGRAANSVPLSAGGHMSPHIQRAKQGVGQNAMAPTTPQKVDFSLYLQASKIFSTFFSLQLKSCFEMPISFHDRRLKTAFTNSRSALFNLPSASLIACSRAFSSCSRSSSSTMRWSARSSASVQGNRVGGPSQTLRGDRSLTAES